MTGFCLFLIDSEIFLHISDPTTHPSDDLKDKIFLLVIQKPITNFLDLFILLILL